MYIIFINLLILIISKDMSVSSLELESYLLMS